MSIPTEQIGSIPRPQELIKGMQEFQAGRLSQKELNSLCNAAVIDTIKLLEATNSPVITDGEQAKPSFATYPIHGMNTIEPDGVTISFSDGHTRQLPKLNAGQFQYKTYADSYLDMALKYASVPVKQAVVSASALSLIYPQDGLEGYSREIFLADLLREHETDIRRCLHKGAYKVQIDFTEGRLAVKLDPTKQLLKNFIDLNNSVLDRFSVQERKKIGVHTCPGGDHDSTHSAEVDYADLLPSLFELKVGNFYIKLASEKNRTRVLKIIRECMKNDQKIFVGVIDPNDSRIETPKEVQDRVLEAAEYIPLSQLGTTDDCGFSPFGDDTSTSRETAFEKIRSRVSGTMLAAKVLNI